MFHTDLVASEGVLLFLSSPVRQLGSALSLHCCLAGRHFLSQLLPGCCMHCILLQSPVALPCLKLQGLCIRNNICVAGIQGSHSKSQLLGGCRKTTVWPGLGVTCRWQVPCSASCHRAQLRSVLMASSSDSMFAWHTKHLTAEPKCAALP